MIHPDIFALFSGYRIYEQVGNNVFSYSIRKNRIIWVPPLIQGNWTDVKPGDQIVFSEVEDGVEKNVTGLHSLVYFSRDGKDFFITDNHHHVFMFWVAAIRFGSHPAGLKLIHMDMHKDMRKPAVWPERNWQTMKEFHDYALHYLNVGNFIAPALHLQFFSEVQFVESSMDFPLVLPEGSRVVADIDLDLFHPDLSYIPEEEKLSAIIHMIHQSDLVSIATSPFFIPQDLALKYLRKIFERLFV